MPGQGLAKKRCVLCHEPVHGPKIARFDLNRESWTRAQKRYHMNSHMRGEAVLLLEKLHALGMRAVICLARPGRKPEHWVSELLAPRCRFSDTAAGSLKRIQGLFKTVIKGWTEMSPEAEPGDTETPRGAQTTPRVAEAQTQAPVLKIEPSVDQDELPPVEVEGPTVEVVVGGPTVKVEGPTVEVEVEGSPTVEVEGSPTVEEEGSPMVEVEVEGSPTVEVGESLRPQDGCRTTEGTRRKRKKRKERSPSVCDRHDEEASCSGETRGAPPEETSPSGGRAERNCTQDKEAPPGSSGVNTQLTLTSTFFCPECLNSFTAQIFLYKHIKRSHVELYSQLLKRGEIRAESLLPSVASQPIADSGTGQKPSNSKRRRSHCCDQCGKSFSYLSLLKRHQCVHTGEKPYQCDQCGESFSKLGYLKRHQRVHTGEKLYQCDRCGKSFSNSSSLKRHQRVHTGEKPYQCDRCGKSCSGSGDLKKHQRVHTGEKPYQCHRCGESFSESGSLKRHQRVHTGEKPYQCDRCGESFSHSGDLKRHQRVHTGEKPYQCDRCGESFSNSGHLKRHQRVHTGEKPYQCDRCGKSFSQSGNLKVHQRVHTGEK